MRGMSVRTCDSSWALESSIGLVPSWGFMPNLGFMPGCVPKRPDGYHRAGHGGETLGRAAVAHGNFQQFETSKRSERRTFAGVAVCFAYLHRRARIDPNGKPHSGKACCKPRQRIAPAVADEIAEAIDVEHLAAQFLDSLPRRRQLQGRQTVAQRRPQRAQPGAAPRTPPAPPQGPPPPGKIVRRGNIRQLGASAIAPAMTDCAGTPWVMSI